MTSPPDPVPSASRVRVSSSVALLASLLTVSLGGVAVMDFGERWAMWYWAATTLVFAGASIAIAYRDHPPGTDPSPHVWRQLGHWGTVSVGIALVFALDHLEHLPARTGGLVALLMLAVGTVLAGVHLSGRIAVLGALLLVASLIAMVTEQFFWITLIPALVFGAFALLRARRERQPSADPGHRSE